MIISASRRTDIPAHYGSWFFNRLAAGYVLVRNPRNFHAVSKIPLTPQSVDGIVFWTKNPLPLLDRLDALAAYPFYFQFTLNAYDKDIEPGLYDKRRLLLQTFQKLSALVGKERVLWRYDPILLTDTYTAEVHCRRFANLAAALDGATGICTVSFLDFYRHLKSSLAGIANRSLDAANKKELLLRFSEITANHGIRLALCAESDAYGIPNLAKTGCIDAKRLRKPGSWPLSVPKDKNQREHCYCHTAVDIGMYDSCPHRCLYCYANHAPGKLSHNLAAHDPTAPFLYGTLQPGDNIRETKQAANTARQLQLF